MKECIDESFVFDINSILLSDVYSDDTPSDKILSNLELQLVWASKVRFYMIKFMLPWDESDKSKRFKCRFDKRVLMAKSRYNSSEMRLWGCFNSIEQELDFRVLDRRIAYFNRYTRFEHETCVDCWRIGRFFKRSRIDIPNIVHLFFQDRGYEIWRYMSMYQDYNKVYENVSYNDVSDGDFSVYRDKYDCNYPLAICNSYLRCDWCSGLMNTLFDIEDFQWLGIYLDANRGLVFDDSDLERIRARSDYSYINNYLVDKYSEELRSLKSCLDPVRELDMIEWNENNVLDSNGDPIEMMDLG